jgi:glycosyltransferase involved in cell wall biosynthesis
VVQPEPPFKFGTLARLDRVKGIDILLNNLVRFRQQFPDTDWIFFHAGGGGDMPLIPNSIRENVNFIGPVDEPFEFLKSINVYLSGSLSESFNISVLEAISQGLPCLISDIRGHHHFIEAGVATGFRLDNSDDFCIKLDKILRKNDKDQLTQKKFLEGYSKDQNADKYLKFLQKVVYPQIPDLSDSGFGR